MDPPFRFGTFYTAQYKTCLKWAVLKGAIVTVILLLLLNSSQLQSIRYLYAN